MKQRATRDDSEAMDMIKVNYIYTLRIRIELPVNTSVSIDRASPTQRDGGQIACKARIVRLCIVTESHLWTRCRQRLTDFWGRKSARLAFSRSTNAPGLV
jgi:hypothetical protein